MPSAGKISKKKNGGVNLEVGHSFADAVQWKNGEVSPVGDFLVKESPLQIYLNGRPFSVTMRTPGDDQALALGLLHSENIIRTKENVIECQNKKNGRGVWVRIPEDLFQSADLANRRLASNSSCGVCGVSSVRELQMPTRPLAEYDPAGWDLILKLGEKMGALQSLFGMTGGCHAAVMFNGEGLVLNLKEDVGRHNAVDKAVGELLLRNQLSAARILMVSGRVSYEIVIKAYRAKVPFLVAVSAPSDLAVEMCGNLGLTLVGFCRGDRATVYTGHKNIR